MIKTPIMKAVVFLIFPDGIGLFLVRGIFESNFDSNI